MKREADDDGPSNKKSTGPGGIETSDGMATGSQAGSSLPGGTGASVSSVIIHNPKDMGHSGMHFKKTFQIYTGGFRFKKTDVGGAQTSSNFRLVDSPFTSPTMGLLTPLAAIIPDILAWYMTPAQFEALPPWTYAKTCRIKITPLGYRLPFATNEANSTYANSQTLVQIAYSVGLNTKWNMITAGYNTGANDLTDPTGYDTSIAYDELLYGTNVEDPEAEGSLGASIGVPKHLNMYTTIVKGTSTYEDPPLLDHICIQNVNDCKGIPIINYEYTFKNGLIKMPNREFVQRQRMRQGFQIPQALGENEPPLVDSTGNSGALSGVHPPNTINQSNLGVFNSYKTLIEKAPLFNRQLGQCQQPDRPPIVHFGVMPVVASAALATTPAYSDVVVQWMVECELSTETNFNYADTVNQLAYLGAYDPNIYTSGSNLTNNLDSTNPLFYVSNRLAKTTY